MTAAALRGVRVKRAGVRLCGIAATMAAAGCTALFGSFDKIDGDAASIGDALDATSSDDAERDTALVDDARDATSPDDTESDGGMLDSSAGDGDTGGGDAGCTLYEHQCPSLACWCPIGAKGCPPPSDAASTAKYFSCLPTGNTADPSTYSAALIDEQIAHVEASNTRTWSRFSFSCSGQPCVGLSFSGTSGSAPYYEAHLWCNTGGVIGRSGQCSATGSTSCTPSCDAPTSAVQWW
jgi:hypothetical protein